MRALVVVAMLGLVKPLAAAPLLDAIDVVDDATAVHLHLSAPVVPHTETLGAEGGASERIYVDLPDTLLDTALPRVTPGRGALLRVRAGQFTPTTARVVLDLVRSAAFTVEQADATITIRLTAAPIAAVAPTKAPTAATTSTSPRTARAAEDSASATPCDAEPSHPPTPRRASRPPVAALPEHPLVVVDAGHGGRDPGAAGVGGVLEKDVVLELAQVVARRLSARLPVDVLMTRVDDSFVPIQRRLAATGAGATLFLSLHANACSDASARGLEIFYGGGALRPASSSAEDRRAALFGRCLDEALEARVGGVRGAARPGSFGVLVRNPVPSALVEIGYLTHPDEAARAQDTRYQELLADALADAVAAFLRASAPRL